VKEFLGFQIRLVVPMLVRLFWRDCKFRDGRWGAEPIDAFWVEATQDEAEEGVFPRLRAEAVDQSRRLANDGFKIAEQVGKPPRPFCFLVPRDLRTVEPFEVHYPFHQLWGASSPFELMAAQMISHLEELESLRLPENRVV
jgi:hypothetical protein